jgi:hypothetical protein
VVCYSYSRQSLYSFLLSAQNPTNTVFDAKRLIGRNFSDKTVQDDMKLWPFKIVSDNGKPIIEVEYQGKAKRFKAEEISVSRRRRHRHRAFVDRASSSPVFPCLCLASGYGPHEDEGDRRVLPR